MSEQPQPFQALADATAVAKQFSELVATFLKPIAKEGGELCADHLRGIRERRAYRVAQEAHDQLQKRGLKPKPVPPKVLFPLLDAASLEEDDEMGHRWASLLASAANPNNKSASEASFVEILKQISPPEAFLLDVFYDQIERDKTPPEEWEESGYVLSDLKEFLQKEIPEFDVALENVLRLNLVAFPTASIGVANGRDVRIRVTNSNILCATALGKAFVSACGHGWKERTHFYGVPGDSISNVFWTEGGPIPFMSSVEEKLWRMSQPPKS